MKQTSKRLLSLIMALAMILSLVPVMAFAAETTTIYLKPGDWNQASAWFEAWVWGSSSSGAWHTFADSDGDGVFEAEIPADTTGLIILRKAPENASGTWDCWNRVGDVPYDGTNNCISITGWSETSFSWSNYEPPTNIPEWESPVVNGDSVTFNYWSSDTLTSVEVRGTINNWTDTAEHHMTQNAETGIWSVTVSGLYNGTYEYKLVTNGTNWINDPKNTGAQIGGNNTFTITDGLVDVNEPEYTSPEVSGSSVTFNYWTSEEVTSAVVYGSMSNDDWATAYTMTKNEDTGIWSVTVSDLYNGTYEYKIVVDGAWLKDPKNENVATSGNSVFEITESTDKPVVTRNVTLHFQDTLDWGSVYAHIWNAGDYGTTWPGTQMEAEGGYTNWYIISTTVTTETISLIFNNGTGGEGYQTGNLSISNIPETDCEYWFVPSEEGWWTGTFETDAPETYVKEETGICDVTLHFKNTLGWEAVNGYAWTNTWPATYPIEAWPGTALTADENGWYTVSFSAVYPLTDTAVYAIFNYVTDAATVQTADLYIDCTDKTEVEKWIIPTGVQNDYLSYECDIYDAEPVETAQVNGVNYYTVADAIANANGSVIKLVNDSVVALEIAADVTIDLAGHKLDEVTVTDGYSLTLIDTAGDDYTSASCGVAYVKGTVNAFGGADGKNYLTILNSDGQYISHRYDVALTHISLDPANDALGYKAELYGDETVQQYVTGFGFNLGVDGGVTKSYSKTGTQNLTLRLKNIMAVGGGEMNINASAFVTLTVGEESNTQTCDTQTTTMKETLQAVDAAWETAGYTEEQKTAVQALCTQYYDDMTDWNLTNIFPTIEIPIE